MPLYKIMFKDRHEYVLAEDWQMAVDKWAEKGTA